MRRLLCRTILLLVVCVPNATLAKERPQLDLTAFPEASPERALPEIVNGLRRFLLDSSSITDFALCKPVSKFKLKDGKLEFWTYLFSLNSKNAYGGYAGVQHYAAIFKPGKPVSITSITMPGSDGFSSLANSLVDKEMRKCDFLPNEKIQKLLSQR